uniref:interferon-induced, double-stranded RNA-activated protein kinase-like n=1 Tax=Gasterosteus aculeatus aculeatus TaxID=481459 RepID=UPI001A9A2449|nr:interferon-induced, double-stranded RNA-activated protein kinase-like [Gasterosteus aculeatus aculeatus]
METRNYLSELNEYAKATRAPLKFEGFAAGPGYDLTHTQWVVFNGKVYPNGVGKNKKEAKHNAAKNALEYLLENRDQNTDAEEKHCSSGQQKDKIDQTVWDISNRFRRLSGNLHANKDRRREGEADFISMIAQYCQKTNRCHSYIEERRRFLDRRHQFFYKLMIDKRLYPEGEGGTVKEAKRNAARLAWSALQEQSDWDSKVSINSTAEDCPSPVLLSRSTTQESLESSAESRPMGTGSPITSNPSRAQIPLTSAASGHAVFDRLSATSSLESLASSQSQSTGTSGSVIFTDSSNSSRDQDAVKVQISGNSQKETSIPSRFTSEFDPMELLGRGAFGRVYKAKHKMLNNVYYAVKVVRCEEKSLREMGTLSELLHPNIVRYYTFWVEDSGYRNPELADGAADSSDTYGSSQTSSNSSAKYFYIQMELCDTKTLKHWIVEKNKESLQDSKRREEGHSITEQIVSAVEYIHSKRHVHRDLKPENILFGLDGKAKIGDFGLVTQDDDGDDNALMERSRERGTHSYMAPEQREKKYDRKVDIFALGLIYFEILWKLSTGHERAEVWNDARSQKLPEMFSQTFPLENQIIKSMLHQKPEDRPEASELKAKMEICAQIYNTQNVHLANATA